MSALVPPTLPEAHWPFWDAFVRTRPGQDVSSRYLESFCFADSEAVANELAELVRSGRKRATAALVWSNEEEGKQQPEPGALSIVTTWGGDPVCIIETRQVEVAPFDSVTADFAATEGEGDGSLAFWRRAHWNFFGRECARMGREPSLQMPVVFERFRVVYPVADRDDVPGRAAAD